MVDNSTNISTKSPTTSDLKSLKSKINYMTYANDNPRPERHENVTGLNQLNVFLA